MNIKTMACAAFMVPVAIAAVAADRVRTDAGGDAGDGSVRVRFPRGALLLVR